MSLAVRTRKIQPWKVQVVEELRDLFARYKTVVIADLTETPTNVVQKIRKELRRYGETRVAKKSLIIKAVESLGLSREAFEKNLQGTVLLIFSNENPFVFYTTLESLKVAVDAKPGQIAPKDIVVPEGPTNIPAGPMLGLLGRLKIPYEVRGGKAYIKKATVVVKAGQAITPDVASILQKIGIKPIELSLKVVAAYDNGVFIPADSLKLDLEAYKSEFRDAVQDLLKVALEASIFDVEEVVPFMITYAERRAETLAEELAVPIPGLLESSIRRALAEELSVIYVLGDKARELGIEEALPTLSAQPQPASTPATTTETKAGEEEEKKEEEVDLSSGLSGLFGF